MFTLSSVFVVARRMVEPSTRRAGQYPILCDALTVCVPVIPSATSTRAGAFTAGRLPSGWPPVRVVVRRPSAVILRPRQRAGEHWLLRLRIMLLDGLNGLL